MSQATELIGEQMSAATNVRNIWGNIMFNVKAYGAIGNGVIDDTVSIQMAINAAIAANSKSVFFPSGTYKVTSLTGLSSVALFGDNAYFSGITNPIQQLGTSSINKGAAEVMTYNSTPVTGDILHIIDGDSTNPSIRGTVPSIYIQRVDNSVTVDDPGHLMCNIYSTMKRKPTGRGWLYSALFYLEDQSNSGAAQSVAVAGMAYASGNAKVWGVYGDAYSYNPLSTITGAEFDAQNFSGSDYAYNAASPTTVPFSNAVWAMSFGTKHNSFGVGIGGGGTSLWGCGLYLQANAIKDVGIDMQATPPVLIKLHGASNDGKGSVPGGIGIDAGAGAFYGQSANQGFLHMRDEDICFGETGLGKIRFNATTGYLEFWYNGARKGYLDCAGADHAI